MNNPAAKTVLVISDSYDPSTNQVIDHLNDMGTKWIRLNFDRIVSEIRCDWRLGESDEQPELLMASPQGRCRATDVAVVWPRRFHTNPVYPDHISRLEKSFLARETKVMWWTLYETLKHKVWINDIHAAGVVKPQQLTVAKRCGLLTPPTLVSNTPDSVRRFIAAFGPKVVAKPTEWGRVGSLEEAKAAQATGRSTKYSMIYTTLIGADDVTDDAISVCPVIYQKYIEKAFELRIVILDDLVFSAAIDVNAIDPTLGDKATVDWRRTGENILKVPHHEYRLPEKIKSSLLQMMRQLNLVFGCVDMIVTEEGEHYFLEVNPTGQFGWLEAVLGFPISQSIAEKLSSYTA